MSLARRKWLFTIAAILVLGTGLVLAFRCWNASPPAIGARQPLPGLVWVFEAPEPGFVVAAPCLADSTVYLSVGHRSGFYSRGALYAIDRATGKSKWLFDRGGEMLPSASTPLIAGNRLIFGEGLHSNFACRLQCLDAGSGAALWTYPTGDHIEGSPVLAENTIVFSAGNDGLVCVDAATGKRLWNYSADIHIDSTPWVERGRVYIGSGPSRRFSTQEVICLDLQTGSPNWRMPVKLPAWGSPVVAAGQVFIGLGNGRLTQAASPPDSPAGALACFDAASGAERWSFPVGDAVFAHPVVVGDKVIFGSRDGNLYGLSFDGQERFRIPLGGPVMAAATSHDGLVYAVSVPGRLVCIDPAVGAEVWRYEMDRRGGPAEVYSSPRVSGSQLFQASELKVGLVSFICLHCFELPRAR